jgi:RNA polymerase sigma factor (sigma-70 family)
MNYDRCRSVLRQVSELFRCGTVAGMTDGQLLERYATRRGPEAEVAFGALVTRHGPLVLGVCRQLSADTHDADDAFQTTFLTLARKAGSLRHPDRLGPWLYGVAVRKTLKLRQQQRRRRKHEGRGGARIGGEFPAGSTTEHQEQLTALYDELARLPEKYRVPIVLCYLENHTHDSAAAELGWPVGTVRGRLARARDRLRLRMTARGLAPASMLLGTASFRDPVRARLSPALADAVVRGATRVAGGWEARLAGLAALRGSWPNWLGARVSRVTAVAVLAGGVAAGGLAALRRVPLGESRPSAQAKAAAVATSPAAAIGPRESDHGQPRAERSLDSLPPWVSDAIRNINPECTILRAVRESDTVYLVDISKAGANRSENVTVRVTGWFAEGRQLTTIRRVRDRSLQGHPV